MKGLKDPHIFNASSNPQKLIKSLSGILVGTELDKIRQEVDKNVRDLFKLGEEHFLFACSLPHGAWRQRASRFYYGAYNIRRAVVLKFDGSFSTDSSDHQKIDSIPDDLNNVARYKVDLKSLRDDRNLADYSHLAQSSDLLIDTISAESLVRDFVLDSRSFLGAIGVSV